MNIQWVSFQIILSCLLVRSVLVVVVVSDCCCCYNLDGGADVESDNYDDGCAAVDGSNGHSDVISVDMFTHTTGGEIVDAPNEESSGDASGVTVAVDIVIVVVVVVSVVVV